MKVFVYGTLKPGQVNYKRYCGDRVLTTALAQVQGQLFDLPLGYPAMTAGDGWVQGYLLQFAEGFTLAALDRLEDYQPDRFETQNEYQRKEVEVFDPKGRSLGLAWAYFMTYQKVQQYRGQWIASGEWQGRK